MPAPTPDAKRWTADEARRLNEENLHSSQRYEVVDGELLVSLGPRAAHQFVVAELMWQLGNYLRGSRIADVLSAPADLELEHDSTVAPDVFVVARVDGRRIRNWPDISSPLLAAEVLSPSTARNDRVVKRKYHLRNGVAVYWIIDIDARLVEQWQEGQDRPEIIADQLVWQPAGMPEPLIISLEALFADVNEF